MDLVYVVRPGEYNQELRYSLRTVALNLPHDRIFIVGHTPAWVTGVHTLQTIQAGTKYANSKANVIAACSTAEVSDPFILMNDDFFVTAPIDAVPNLHGGPLADELAAYRAKFPINQRMQGMAQTLDLLHSLGHDQPLSYELHVPLVVAKAAMLDVINTATAAGIEVPHKRSLYGNLAGIGGDRIEDVKVYTNRTVQVPRPFASTSDRIFHSGWIGRRIAADFATPSQYERERSGRRAL